MVDVRTACMVLERRGAMLLFDDVVWNIYRVVCEISLLLE